MFGRRRKKKAQMSAEEIMKEKLRRSKDAGATAQRINQQVIQTQNRNRMMGR